MGCWAAYKGKVSVGRLRVMIAKAILLLSLGLGVMLTMTTCSPSQPNPLDELGAVTLSIKGQPFKLWIADDATEQARGLMFITSEQMATLPDGTELGMIFVMDHERTLSFWMKNTIIPLDIAYLATDGTVVTTYTMAPLDTRFGQYPSTKPARIAIEVNADVWSKIGLTAGDRITIPDSVLNPTP